MRYNFDPESPNFTPSSRLVKAIYANGQRQKGVIELDTANGWLIRQSYIGNQPNIVDGVWQTEQVTGQIKVEL